MLNIEYMEKPDEKLGKSIGVEFSKFANENRIDCN